MKFINKNCKIKIETEIKTRENQNQQQQWIHQPVLNANHSKTHTNTHSIHKYTHFFVASENEQHTCRSTTDNRPPHTHISFVPVLKVILVTRITSDCWNTGHQIPSIAVCGTGEGTKPNRVMIMANVTYF